MPDAGIARDAGVPQSLEDLGVRLDTVFPRSESPYAIGGIHAADDLLQLLLEPRQERPRLLVNAVEAILLLVPPSLPFFPIEARRCLRQPLRVEMELKVVSSPARVADLLLQLGSERGIEKAQG